MTAHGLIVTLAVLCGASIGGWVRAEVAAFQERRRAEAVAAAAARDAERIRVAAVEAERAEAAWARYYHDVLGGPFRAGPGHEQLAGHFLRLRENLDTARSDSTRH